MLIHPQQFDVAEQETLVSNAIIKAIALGRCHMSTQDKLDDTLTQIADQVNAIAHLVGQTAELQLQTQHKLDQLADTVENLTKTVDGLTVAIREQQSTINSYQDIAREQARTTAELIKLVTLMMQKAA